MLTTIDPLTFPGSVLGTGYGTSMDSSILNPAFANTGAATVPTARPMGFMSGVTGFQLANGSPATSDTVQCTQDAFAAAAAAGAGAGGLTGASGMSMLMYRMFGNTGYTGQTSVQPSVAPNTNTSTMTPLDPMIQSAAHAMTSLDPLVQPATHGMTSIDALNQSAARYLPYDSTSLEVVAQHAGAVTAAGSPPCATSPISALSSLTAAGQLGVPQVTASPLAGATGSLAPGAFGVPSVTSAPHVSGTPSAAAAGSAPPTNFTAMQLQYLCYPQYRLTSYGGLRPLIRTPDVRCETCDITLNSPAQARQHFAGKSHLRRLNPKAGGNKRNRGKTKEGGGVNGVGSKRKSDDDPEDEEGSPAKILKDDVSESSLDGDSDKSSDRDHADQCASSDSSPDSMLDDTNSNIAKSIPTPVDYNDNEKLSDTSSVKNSDKASSDTIHDTTSNVSDDGNSRPASSSASSPEHLPTSKSEHSQESADDDSGCSRSSSKSPASNNESPEKLTCTCGNGYVEDAQDENDSIMSGPSKNEYYSSDKTTESVAQSTGVEGGEGAEEPSRKRKAEDVPCEVCHTMFNSYAQYNAHVSGSKHMRAAQLAQGLATGASEASGASAASGAASAHPDCEHYCSICVSGFTSATQLASHLTGSKHAKRVKLLPEGSEDKALAERLKERHCYGGATPGSRTGGYNCTPCELSFNSSSQLEQHLAGGKHERKMCELRGETIPVKERKVKPKTDEADKGEAEGDEGNKVKESSSTYTCVVCTMQFNSQEQANAHLEGARHKKRADSILAATSGHGPRAGFGSKPCGDAPMIDSASGKYSCEVCHVNMNSYGQLEVHKSGSRHKMAVDARTAQYSSDKNPLGEVNGHVGGLYYCATCDISVTTAQLLHKHMNTPHHMQRKNFPRAPGKFLHKEPIVGYTHNRPLPDLQQQYPQMRNLNAPQDPRQQASSYCGVSTPGQQQSHEQPLQRFHGIHAPRLAKSSAYGPIQTPLQQAQAQQIVADRFSPQTHVVGGVVGGGGMGGGQSSHGVAYHTSAVRDLDYESQQLLQQTAMQSPPPPPNTTQGYSTQVYGSQGYSTQGYASYSDQQALLPTPMNL